MYLQLSIDSNLQSSIAISKIYERALVVAIRKTKKAVEDLKGY